MDRRERGNDPVESVRVAFEGMRADIWTALPGIVESYDPALQTVKVQPAIKARVFSPDDSPPLPGAVFQSDNWWTVPLPVLVDVPVVFPGAGAYSLTFPILSGDEVLLIFAARSIDNWWYQSRVQPQSMLTMHDLSDAFAIPGPRSRPRAIPNVSATKTQLRSDDGSVMLEIGPGAITVKAAAINLENAGAALKTLVNQSFKATFDAHVHIGVVAGGALSGAPQTAMPANNLTTVTKAE